MNLGKGNNRKYFVYVKNTVKIVPAVFLIVSFVLLIVSSLLATNRRIIEQNSVYVAELTEKNAQSLDELFFRFQDGITNLGKMYGNITNGQPITSEQLVELSYDVRYDSVMFVDLDGNSTEANGETRYFADDEKVKDALGGKSGTTVSAYNDPDNPERKRLLFYAPCFDNGRIVGAFFGYINEEVISQYMNISIFGEYARTFLCDSEGNIIASNKEYGENISVVSFFVNEGLIEDNETDEIFDGILNNDTYTFLYNGIAGKGNASTARLEKNNLILLETFPSQANVKIINDTSQILKNMAIGSAILFLFYLLVLILMNSIEKRAILKESSSINNIAQIAIRMFARFAVVNLENNTYKFLKRDNAVGYKSEGEYKDLYAEICKNFYLINDENRTVGDVFSIEYFKERLKTNEDMIRFEYASKNDEPIYRNIAILPCDWKKDKLCRVVFIIQDVTELKAEEMKNHNAMKEAYKAAESASSAKSDFLSKMSHDIRTPMNAIIGMTAIASSHIGEEDRVMDCLKKITSSSKHLLALINEVLDMSKIESGKFSLSEDEFDLSELIETMLNMVRPMIKEKGHNLSVFIEDIEHEKVIGDSLHIQQIFVNIMSNAIKYTPGGGEIKMTVKEKATAMHNTGCYEFVFEDNGMGMSKEFIERIFVPFERADDSRTDKIQGTGLGMAIANSIVRMMGGDIKVESELNVGSKFTVTIVLKLQDTNDVLIENLQGLSVLVVDDEKVACEVACNMIDSLGMKSEWVLSGKEAVERVVENHDKGKDFYAIVLDWKMPEMNGIETAKEIRRKVGFEVPMIIMSAYDWTEIEMEAKSAGVDSFITKPLFKSKLSSAFKNLFSQDEADRFEKPLDVMENVDYSGKKVLLVEDNELNAEIAKEILEMTGVEVEHAENGKVAVEMVSENPEGYYNLILMDVQMPVMNGYDAARAIRALPRRDLQRVPIIAMTANAFVEDVLAAKDSGMNEHMAKPIDLEVLNKILKRWLV